jgi:hypothetical protein
MTKEDFYVATTLAVIFISFCALSLTIWQGYLSRRHNQLSLRPALSSWNLYNPAQYIHRIMNKGHGTAIISNFNFLINDNKVSYSEFEKDIYDFAEAYGACSICILAFTKENFMSSGESFNVIDIKYTKKPSPEFFELLSKRYGLTIKYNCLYGNTFEFIQKW